MTEQQFEVFQECEYLEEWSSCPYCIKYDGETVFETLPLGIAKEVCKKLNEQQEFIEELQVSDEMGWKRAKHFEKKCPKELHNKKMYIKRLEYKVQKFKEENEQLRLELETHKHPLWSTREAEKKVNKLADSLADEVKKNGLLNEEINQLRIENMRLKKDIDIYEYEEKKHSETVRKLYEENEKLGKELKELENNYKDLLYDGGFDE